MNPTRRKLATNLVNKLVESPRLKKPAAPAAPATPPQPAGENDVSVGQKIAQLLSRAQVPDPASVKRGDVYTVVGYDDNSFSSGDPGGWFSMEVKIMGPAKQSTMENAFTVKTPYGRAELAFDPSQEKDERGVQYNGYFEFGMGGEDPVAVVRGSIDFGVLTNHEWEPIGDEDADDPVWSNPRPREGGPGGGDEE